MWSKIVYSPSPQIQEQTVEVAKAILEERVQHHREEQIDDMPVHADNQPAPCSASQIEVARISRPMRSCTRLRRTS